VAGSKQVIYSRPANSPVNGARFASYLWDSGVALGIVCAFDQDGSDS
jgi:hypothetical protein